MGNTSKYRQLANAVGAGRTPILIVTRWELNPRPSGDVTRKTPFFLCFPRTIVSLSSLLCLELSLLGRFLKGSSLRSDSVLRNAVADPNRKSIFGLALRIPRIWDLSKSPVPNTINARTGLICSCLGNNRDLERLSIPEILRMSQNFCKFHGYPEPLESPHEKGAVMGQ
jgi:hypothetical protein